MVWGKLRCVDGLTVLSGVGLRAEELDSFSKKNLQYIEWLETVSTKGRRDKGRRDRGQLRNGLYLLYLVNILSGQGVIDREKSLVSGPTQPEITLTTRTLFTPRPVSTI